MIMLECADARRGITVSAGPGQNVINTKGVLAV